MDRYFPSKKTNRIVGIPIFLLFVLMSCQFYKATSNFQPADISTFYPVESDNKETSFMLVERHESQYWTNDIPYLVSYPLKWKFIFVKYVIEEDLYNGLDKGKVILVPIGVSLAKTNSGARPKYNILSVTNNSPTSSPYNSDNQEDPSTGVFRSISYQYATYYFTAYHRFMIYVKDYQIADNEKILTNLDLHNTDTSIVDLEELKKDVDYVSIPIYLDSELCLIPFNRQKEAIEIRGFYSYLYERGLDECPIFYEKYQEAQKCFIDNTDTFETIKNRIKC